MELVLYMPLLMFVIFLTIQFALIYLGNQVANNVARETARVARTTGDFAAARARGEQYARQIGRGSLNGATVRVRPVGAERVQVVVGGRAQELIPWGVPRVEETIEGPVEEFREDELSG